MHDRTVVALFLSLLGAWRCPSRTRGYLAIDNLALRRNWPTCDVHRAARACVTGPQRPGSVLERTPDANGATDDHSDDENPARAFHQAVPATGFPPFGVR